MSFWNEKFGETTLSVKGGVTTLTKNDELVATTDNFPLKKGIIEKALELVEKIPLGVIKEEPLETGDDKEKEGSSKTSETVSETTSEKNVVAEDSSSNTTDNDKTASNPQEVPATPSTETVTPVEVLIPETKEAEANKDSEKASNRTKIPTATEVVIEAKVG